MKILLRGDLRSWDLSSTLPHPITDHYLTPSSFSPGFDPTLFVASMTLVSLEALISQTHLLGLSRTKLAGRLVSYQLTLTKAAEGLG